MIRVSNFSKSYRQGLFGSVLAVDNISFEIEKGKAVGFLGDNGAGKSTTIRALLGLIKPSNGNIRVMKKSPADPSIINKIGYLSEVYPVSRQDSIFQELQYLGRVSGMNKLDINDCIKIILEKVGLTNDIKKKGKELSKGKVQRLGLAQALLHKPELLILDEPTTGLDPQGRIIFSEIIEEEKDKGNTIFFSSHILSDIEKLCDEVIIIKSGSLISKIDISSLDGQSLENYYKDIMVANTDV